MPGFDGTGPSGQGPMTGRGRGFCVLRVCAENPKEIKGFAGLQGMPVNQDVENPGNATEVIRVPFGDGTGPAGLRPLTGRVAGVGAGFLAPAYGKHFVGGVRFAGSSVGAIRPYRTSLDGYALPYGVQVSPWFRRAFGRGRGFGRARGRGRFGHWR
jgi:hypothetical protein